MVVGMAAWGYLGYLWGEATTQARLESRVAYAQSLCPNGIVGYHDGDFYCFTEQLQVKQWRPRWHRAVIVSEH